MGLIHGTLFNGAQAFGNPNTILPVFLQHFSSSRILVGLSSTLLGSLGGIGNVLPQLFVARRLETKIHKKPVLITAITIRALCWGSLALATFFLAQRYARLMVLLLFLLLLIFTIMGGVASIPFYDIVAKALSPTMRGRFFGHRQFWGGILAAGSGYIAKIILGSGRIGFPDNFGTLFLLAFALMGMSYIALGSIREPEKEVYKTPLAFKYFVKKAFSVIRIDKNYRIFLIVQILSGAGAMALPFYVLHAKDNLHLELGMVGVLLMAQMGGGVVSNVFWGYLSDLAGNKKVLQLSTLVGVLPPACALFIPAHLSILFVPVYIFIGFYIAGRTIGKTNFLLDIAPQKERPAYISLNGTLTFPVTLLPLFGGIIAQHISYLFLFVITSMLVAIGFFLSCMLKEPRGKTTQKKPKIVP